MTFRTKTMNGCFARGKAGCAPVALGGFSMVEVALAMGVLSFSILSMLSLVVIGLGSYGDSRAQTRATGIATAVVADLTEVIRYPKAGGTTQKSPLLGLDPALDKQTLYFDQNEVLKDDASGAVYTASLTLVQPQPSASSSTGITGTLRIHWIGGGKKANDVTVFIAIAQE